MDRVAEKVEDSWLQGWLKGRGWKAVCSVAASIMTDFCFYIFLVSDPQQQCINAWTRYEPENGVYHKSSQMYKTIPDTKPHFGDGFLQLWIPKVVETLEQKHVLLAVLFFWGACKIFKDCQKLWNIGHPHFQRIWSDIQILPAGFESGTHNVLHHLSKSAAVPGFTSRRCWYFFFGGNWLEPSLSCMLLIESWMFAKFVFSSHTVFLSQNKEPLENVRYVNTWWSDHTPSIILWPDLQKFRCSTWKCRRLWQRVVPRIGEHLGGWWCFRPPTCSFCTMAMGQKPGT